MYFSKAIKIVPIAAAFALVSACGVQKTTVPINPSYTRAATCDEAVNVYTDRAQVPHDYYELAWIAAEANSVYTTDGKIRSEIVTGAAKVGANGVIINPAQEANATVKVLGEAIGAQSATTKVNALAIYMPADSADVLLKCGPH